MRTFVDVLKDNAQYADQAITFLRTNGQERIVDYNQLWLEARKRAHALRQRGISHGDRVAIVLTEPDEFVLSFIGAITAGAIPVPMYPPQTLAKLESYGETLRHILDVSGARLLITSHTLRAMLEEHLPTQSIDIVLESEVQSAPNFDCTQSFEVSLDDIAFLQFTSGSTSKPKGVMVTHRNLSTNAHAIMVDGLHSTPEDRGVSWLPLYHDMGLIGFVIAPLYTRVQVMFLPTMSFIRRPSLWLDAIHRFRATITFAPNFAFALATKAVTEAQSAPWDLSCLRAVGCGAEPIQSSVLHAFMERFRPNRLSLNTILPSYGMAEATLAITFHKIGMPIHTDRVSIENMNHGKATLDKFDHNKTLEFVSCGHAFPGHEIAIVNEQGQPLGERTVGEIWFRGPSVTNGYFNNTEATLESFRDGWLRSGDLGYIADGNLYICGRNKDLIIIHGKNYYPHDIEQVVASIDGIRDGQCVAFSRLDASGAEQVVVVAESRKSAEKADEIISQITQAVRSKIGILLDHVVLIKRGTLAKTSSGKVRRREVKQRFESGELDKVNKGYISSIPPAPNNEIFSTTNVI